MLSILAYHRVGIGKYANSLELLEAHFSYIRNNFPTLLPGDPIVRGKLNVSLTFDDATFDFYHYVFPLLKKYQLRALVAVPTNYILEESLLSPEIRLQVPYPLAMQEGFYEKKAPFCTWKELEEMVLSGHVEVAAHSHLHCNLTFDFVDLEREVIQPKRIIEERLPQIVSSFVYPFGKVSNQVHEFVKEHYLYLFRLGSAYNFSWDSSNKPLKRISCDQLKTPYDPFTFLSRMSYLTKSLL